ncbi:hypothetical protein PUN28_017727 [Cardiocondyla obscurior]
MYTRSGQLSGGQKKRLSIALELVNNPTVMFLDEPTTGLDSSSCMHVVNLLKILARQGRTIVCTIHQPSASLFQLFDQVYVLTKGDCLYQGATNKLVPYLENLKLPCPMYHNPADYMIELACGEYGDDKIDTLIMGSQNGRNLQWFDNPETLKDAKTLRIPLQMSILLKEHFNRWYSLKAFYMAITLIDVPISIVCCIFFSIIVYFMSAQPLEIVRFCMFLSISILIMFIGQGTGLMIGAVFNVVNGTFMGPTIACPLMMFAGFGVSLRDLPSYLKWGTYVSYLRYGLEGFVGAIYGLDRPILECKEKGELYCHYKYPSKFLSDIAMQGDQFWNDVIALATILLITRCGAYILLRWKLVSYR